MLWSKLKNVILAVLLLTNLFLFALVISERMSGDSQEAEAREMAILFLQERGVPLEEDMVPRSLDLVALQGAEQIQEEAVVLLLGAVERSYGGETVRYTSDLGFIEVSPEGNFYGNFTGAVLPVSQKSKEEHGALILEKLGLDCLYLGEVSQGEGTLLVYNQIIQGIPVVDCEIHLYYEEGVLREIPKGRGFSGEFQEGDVGKGTIATALLQFFAQLGEEGCEEMYGIEACYLPAYQSGVGISLQPSWCFVTERGNFYWNSVTSRME